MRSLRDIILKYEVRNEELSKRLFVTVKHYH